MTTTPAQIDLWKQAATEHQCLEFKEAKHSFDSQKLHRYCVALANEGGGHLLLGVSNDPPRVVVGSQAFLNVVNEADRLFQILGFRVEVEAVAHPDGRVVVFQAPARPKGTAYSFEGAYWMRSGSSLTPMSEDKLRTIFAEGQPDWGEKPALIGVDAQRVVDLLDTQAFFDLLKSPYPTDRGGVLERLVAEGLIDSGADGYAISRLGALLLAKRLDQFPTEIARKAPRVIVYAGVNKLATRIDQLGVRGYAVGFSGLVEFVMEQLPQNEVIENALRTKVKLLPDDAVRELVANALIHQDLTLAGMSPMIEVYADRVEISNPGEPVVPVERFIDGYQSRNEQMADIMRRMRICEERSSGVDRVITLAEDYQLPAPSFRAAHRRTVVTVYGPKPFETMDREDRVRASYQHAALRWVMNQRMTNQTLRERFGLGEGKQAITSQIITATIDAGLIKADETVGDSRRYARYLPFWA